MCTTAAWSMSYFLEAGLSANRGMGTRTPSLSTYRGHVSHTRAEPPGAKAYPKHCELMDADMSAISLHVHFSYGVMDVHPCDGSEEARQGPHHAHHPPRSSGISLSHGSNTARCSRLLQGNARYAGIRLPLCRWHSSMPTHRCTLPPRLPLRGQCIENSGKSADFNHSNSEGMCRGTHRARKTVQQEIAGFFLHIRHLLHGILYNTVTSSCSG